MPIFKSFKGHIVKSIGDALLVTFKSPTDAMLCSMSVQDAMHSFNLSVGEEEKIHIRVAANLGEVRVTKNDIFGEPVNITSRIESITPTDEIYLSEALYMAMNKAEVPTREVGFKELAGVSQAVRIYHIPRFSEHRLVPVNVNASTDDQGNEIIYPYGGMHQSIAPVETSFNINLFKNNKLIWVLMALCLFLALLYLVLTKYQDLRITTANEVNSASSAVLVDNNSKDPKDQKKDKPTEKVEAKTSKTSVPEKINSKAKTKAKPKPKPENLTKPKTQAKPNIQPKHNSMPNKWNLATAKSAYNANELSKSSYKKIVYDLKIAYKNKIRQLKIALRNNEITRAQYDQAVNKAKFALNGQRSSSFMEKLGVF